MSQLERVIFINRGLQTHGQITVRQVAGHFEVSERQVKRDIEYMRIRLDAPVVWNPSRQIYQYSRPFDDFRFADERVLLFYVMVRKMACNQSFLPLVSQDILYGLEQALGKEFKGLASAIDYEVPVSEDMNLGHFALICQAIKEGKRLALHYTKASGDTSQREIEVQRLINYVGKWYLVARDCHKEELRTFHMGRIRDLSILETENTWKMDKPELRQQLVQDYLGSGFGIFNGKSLGTVTLRFSGDVAHVVARQQWHSDQKDHHGKAESGQPWLERTLPVTSYAEILGRLLSFGRWARPVAPLEFVRLWEEELAGMVNQVATNVD